MKNPLELFFGRSPPLIVKLLKDRPDWIVKIVGQAKKYMVAQAHPDRGHEGDLARDISEAFSALQDPDRLAECLEDYLARPDPAEPLRLRLRDASRKISGLESELRKSHRELAELQKGLFLAQERRGVQYTVSWQWFVAGLVREFDLENMPKTTFPEGVIPRSLLYKYRVIVETESWRGTRKGGEEKFVLFRGYQFDLSGRVRLVVQSENLDLVKRSYLFKGQKRWQGVRRTESDGSILIGSSETDLSGVRLLDAVHSQGIKPYVSVGRIPVFTYSVQPFETVQSRGKIVEIISLRDTRRALIGGGGIAKTKTRLRTRLSEYKRRKQ